MDGEQKGTYQGWTNWETWHTALLIDNEEDLANKQSQLVKKKASVNEFRNALKKAETDTKRFHYENRKANPEGWGKFEKVNWNEIHKNAMGE